MLTPRDDAEQQQTAPPAPTGDPGAAEHLRARVQATVTAHSSGDEGALVIALDELSRSARQEAVPVERLIVLLKDAWHARSDQVPSRGRPASDQLARLVSACIVSYYED